MIHNRNSSGPIEFLLQAILVITIDDTDSTFPANDNT